MYRNLTLLFLVVVCQFPVHSFAQKVLQIEKRGSVKSDKYYVGQAIRFQIKSLAGVWLEDYITDMDVDDGIVHFTQRDVHIDSVYAIKPITKNRVLNETIPQMLIIGSYSMPVAAIGAIGYDQNYDAAVLALGIGAGAQLVGRSLRQFKRKKVKLGKKFKLRLIELDF